MTAEFLFSLASLAVLPGWFILIFLRRWQCAARVLLGDARA